MNECVPSDLLERIACTLNVTAFQGFLQDGYAPARQVARSGALYPTRSVEKGSIIRIKFDVVNIPAKLEAAASSGRWMGHGCGITTLWEG